MAPRNRDPLEDPDQDGRLTLTAKEGEVFFFLVKNIKSKPDIDWEGFAIDCGWKNSDTAKVRLGQIKRKVGLGNWGENLGSGGGGAGLSSSAPSPAATPAPKAPRAPRSTPKSRKAAQPAALGPSPGGSVTKSRANKSSLTRAKVEGDALIAAALDNSNSTNKPVKTEEPEAPEGEKTHPTLETSDGIEGEAPMELVEDNNLGQITQSPAPVSTRAHKQESPGKAETTKIIPALPRNQPNTTNISVHPAYISEMLSPITGTTGSFQIGHAQNSAPRQNNNDLSPRVRMQPSPVKDWESDDDGKAIDKLRNGASSSSNNPPATRIPSYIDAAHYPIPPRPAPLNRRVVSTQNPNNSGGKFDFDNVPELSLSSMMAGGLPGGGSAGSYNNNHHLSLAQPQPITYRNTFDFQAAYTPSTQSQMQQHYDLTEDDEAEAAHPDPDLFTTGGSLFGGGGSGGRGSGGRGSGRK